MNNLVIGHTPVKELRSVVKSIPRWIGQSLLSDNGRGGLVGLRLSRSPKLLFRVANILFYLGCRCGIFKPKICGIGRILPPSTADLR